MTAFALVGDEESDLQRLQGGLIKRQRTIDIADRKNDVIEHDGLLQSAWTSMALLPSDAAYTASGLLNLSSLSRDK